MGQETLFLISSITCRKNVVLMVKDDEAMQTLSQEVIHLLWLEDQQNILARNMKHWARPQAMAAIVKEIICLARTSRLNQ